MTNIACPHCANLLAESGQCEACGLDGALLLAIRGTARELANEAARHAGAGDWAQAYELAAESLRLMWRDNDLAAFVVLVAAVAGVRGPVRSIPRPRPELLPESLAPHVEDVLATAERLRSGEEAEEIEQVEEVAKVEEEPSPLATDLEAGQETETEPIEAVLPSPPPPWWRGRSAGLSAAAVVLLAAGVLLGELLGRVGSREPLPPDGPLPASPAPAAAAIQARPAPPPALAPALPRIPVAVGHTAWSEGRKASSDGSYAKAREHLEIAVLVPPETFYWDDALYYLARAYHRLGECEKAAGAYDRLIQGSSHSQFVSDARHFRGRLTCGDEVEG